MVLTNEEIKKLYHGAYSFGETDDGYLCAFPYTAEQIEYLKFNYSFWMRSFRSNANTLEMITEATEISFDYRLEFLCDETIELMIDNNIVDVIHTQEKGKVSKAQFKLPDGKKKIAIYLPADDAIYIRNFEINNEYETVTKKEKALWMGDSITQGYGPFRSGEIYVSAANRLLDYEVINQGIGGYYYDAGVLMKMDGYTPDKIILAHGTNQSLNNEFNKVIDYFDKLEKLYPDTPVLAISPIYRGDFEGENRKTFLKFCEDVKELTKDYKNVTLADGFTLANHAHDYFMPDWLHPNAIGARIYGENLARYIKKIGF